MNDKIANPAPLGFLATAVVAWMVSLPYAGWADMGQLDSNTANAAIWVAGVPLAIVAILEFLRGRALYGAFFGGFAIYWWGVASAQGEAASSTYIGWHLLFFTIYFAGLWIAAMQEAKAVMLVFLALAVTYLLHALANFAGVEILLLVAGYTGLITGALAIYVSFDLARGRKKPSSNF